MNLQERKSPGGGCGRNLSLPYREYSWVDGKKLSIRSDKTLVMGILNVTPDSFSDGGRYREMDAALRHMETLVADGADILDIGAESTRPYGNSREVSAEEEMDRLLPVLEKVLAVCPVPVSIDTYKACVADAALKMGAHVVNDVWGLQRDPAMAAVAARHDVPVIVMHNRQDACYNEDLLWEVNSFLARSIEIATAAGLERSKIIVDPGIGFAKTTAHNLELMSRLEELQVLDCPILLGTSRKRFIGEVLNLPVTDRMEGTGATVVLGITKGAQLVRVHDVKQIARMAKMTDAMLCAL